MAKINTLDLPELLIIAIKHMKNGNMKKVEKIAKKMLSLDNNNGDANHLLGLVKLHHSEFLAAVKLLTKATYCQPENADIFNNLGTAYKELGKADSAIESYNKAISIDQNFTEALYNISLPLIDTGKPKEAIDYCNKAIKSNATSSDAWNNLGQALNAEGDYTAAISALERSIVLPNSSYKPRYNLATVFAKIKRTDDAINLYKETIELNPLFFNAYNSLGVIFASNGEFEKSEKMYKNPYC